MNELATLPLASLTDTQPQRDHGDLGDLKDSIRQYGLLEPLVVTVDGKLIAGRRRFQALAELGYTTTLVRLVSPKNPYEEFMMALHENTKRKQLTWQEECHCTLEEKRLYEEQFPETKQGANQWVRQVVESTPAPRYTETKASVAKTSERTVQ